jgi:hypothetical protein
MIKREIKISYDTSPEVFLDIIESLLNDLNIKYNISGDETITIKYEITDNNKHQTKDLIQEGDLIIDTEKIGVSINGDNLGKIVKCIKILDDETLVWESLDGKSSACDHSFHFKKVTI